MAFNSILPFQVSPFDEPWSKESSDRFLKMVKRTGNLGIMANVRGVSIPDKCICVWLYDTATNDLPNGIQINHELCREGTVFLVFVYLHRCQIRKILVISIK